MNIPLSYDIIRLLTYNVNMDEEEFVEYLKTQLTQYPAIANFCVEKNISEGYLGDVLHGRRKAGKKIAGALGYEKTTIYIKKTDDQA